MKENKLFIMLPIWDTLIPPAGMSVLKFFLKQHGYLIKTVDVNVNVYLKSEIELYFEVLKRNILVQKRGNFLNIGFDVLKNHMMAYINKSDETRYKNLVRKIVSRTYYVKLNDDQIDGLDEIVKNYYKRLEKYIIELLKTEKPSIIGFSVFSNTLPSTIFTARIIKKKYPDIETLIGGSVFSDLTIGSVNFDFFYEKTEKLFDKFFIGESELLLLKYFRNEFPESKRIFTIKDLDGEIFSIADVKNPDFSDFDLSYYMLNAYEGSRSCYMQCNFCSETIYKGKYRKKDKNHLITELKEMYEKYKDQLFLMCDSLLNPIINDLSEEITRENIPVYFDGYLRADKTLVNPERTLQWRNGGCYRTRIGVESGSQKVLELMNKKTKIEDIKFSVSSLAESGIKTTTYWICGYPGETEEDFQMTLDLLEELNEDIYEADCNPFIYMYTGQAGSNDFMSNEEVVEVYDSYEKEMLLGQAYALDTEPDRDEIYLRVNRFIEHCKRLNIPNPYTMNEVIDADNRWAELHKNAVPGIVEFKKGNSIVKECRNKKKTEKISNDFDADWEFDL